MKCFRCLFENPESAKTCNRCGDALGIACSACGKGNPPGSKFCNACGATLSGQDRNPAIDYSKPHAYTPKFLAEKILTTRSAVEGERKQVTVLFADVVDYTSISGRLDAEMAHRIMGGCFRILMDEVHRCEGTVNQFTGDGIMALFGAPVAYEDHAKRGCMAALSTRKAMEEYGERIEKDLGVEFKMRLGLNSGTVFVGSIGDDLRMDYTAIGETTNLASRMESLARPGRILVSGHTYRLVKDSCSSPGSRSRSRGRRSPRRPTSLWG